MFSSKLSKNSKFIICASGILVTYFYYGILQEKITRGNYPIRVKDGNGYKDTGTSEKFTYFFTLVFIQCFFSYIFAKILLKIWPKTDDKNPKLYLASTSLTYLLGMVCSNMALKWVPYPTQVIGKSAKPIPVMVMGVLIGGKSYPVKKYFIVLSIVIGVALFMFKDKSNTEFESSFGIGELLLLLSLTMDGLTGAVQDRMRAEVTLSAQHLMQGMNFYSSIYAAIVLIINGEGIDFVNFISRHPSTLIHIATFAVCAAIGQLFILFTVAELGPLVCAIITTSRKFFTVLLSVLLFGNSLTNRQWFATVIVFSGLFLDAYFSKTQSKKK